MNERAGIWLESSPRQDLCENAFIFTSWMLCATKHPSREHNESETENFNSEWKSERWPCASRHFIPRDYRRAECVDEFIMQRGTLHTQPIVQKHEKSAE